MTREAAEPFARADAEHYGVGKTAVSSFLDIMDFISENPDSLSKPRGKKPLPPLGDDDFYRLFSDIYFRSRAKLIAPATPTTIPDPMVSYILEIYFGHSPEHLERIKIEHQHSMAAENLVGALLERYVGTALEALGWAWCAGDFVSAVDLLKKDGEKWHALQVKNRDNTENSSSSAIRDGTEIKKWFRTFSKKPETNWSAFPDAKAREILSEEGFRNFVKEHLAQARKKA